MKTLYKFDFEVERRESNFDRACDEARDIAMSRLGVDDDGYLAKVPEWQRSTDHIEISFVSMKSHIGMMGSSHCYIFRCAVVRG